MHANIFNTIESLETSFTDTSACKIVNLIHLAQYQQYSMMAVQMPTRIYNTAYQQIQVEREFPQLSLLPTELRLDIWEHEMRHHRIIVTRAEIPFDPYMEGPSVEDLPVEGPFVDGD